MKKLLTLALAFAMVFALSVPVFAANTSVSVGGTNGSDTITQDNNTSIDVTATKVPNPEAAVYRVDVAWTTLAFT